MPIAKSAKSGPPFTSEMILKDWASPHSRNNTRAACTEAELDFVVLYIMSDEVPEGAHRLPTAEGQALACQVNTEDQSTPRLSPIFFRPVYFRCRGLASRLLLRNTSLGDEINCEAPQPMPTLVMLSRDRS
jgi:hypothetical protein